MKSKTFILALLASTALAHPKNKNYHHHHHHSGTGSGLATGTGTPFGTGNSTGIFANSTGTIAVQSSTSTSIVSDVVTVVVSPLPVTPGGSTVLPIAQAISTAASSCGGSRSTTTVTSTNVVTVTVDATETSAAAVAPTTTDVAPVYTNSSSVANSTSIGEGFYPAPTTSAISISYSTSYTVATSAPSSSSVASTTVEPVSTAATTSSSASASATGSYSGSTSGSKRGLAYNTAALTHLFGTSPVSWAYNWGATPGGTIGSGLEYVPMFWSPSAISLSDWTSAANSAISSGTTHLLGINEPDMSTQANMSPSDTAAAHIKYMNPLASKASIGSPAVTNGGDVMGLDFMEAFLAACDKQCSLDFMAIHWYSGYFDGVTDYFKSHVTNATEIASANGMSEVWITEFALSGASDSQVSDFLGEVLPWLDGQSGVGRYAYFMLADGILADGNAISSTIGEAYVATTSS